MSESIEWDEEQLAEYKINEKELEVLIRQLERVAVKLEKMNLTLYANGGGVSITHKDRLTHIHEGIADRDSVIAHVLMSIDGGDW